MSIASIFRKLTGWGKSKTPDNTFILKLSHAEALVLSDLLHYYFQDDKMEFLKPGPADNVVFLRILGQLEIGLVEPFRPDYSQLLEEARAETLKGTPWAETVVIR
ncbi:MAG: hypothetical protein V4543_18420 [Bacteroidota bacterium]